MSGDQVMAAAESLYQKGLVSYPRTETDEFDQAQDVQVQPQSASVPHASCWLHLTRIVRMQCEYLRKQLLLAPLLYLTSL